MIQEYINKSDELGDARRDLEILVASEMPERIEEMIRENNWEYYDGVEYDASVYWDGDESDFRIIVPLDMIGNMGGWHLDLGNIFDSHGEEFMIEEKPCAMESAS